MFIIAARAPRRAEKNVGIQVTRTFFALRGTYYAGFMSFFVASELIILICFLLDHSVFYGAIMAH